MLKAKDRNRNGVPKPSALVAVVPMIGGSVSSGFTSEVEEINKSDSNVEFLPFVSDGFVSLPQGEKIPVKILRDTSVSFILGSVLPFSSETFTGDSLLIRGIGMTKMSVPLHKVVLYSHLVQGEVELGVRSALPHRISVVLGNNLAGWRVWSDVSLPLIVSSKPVSSVDIDENLPSVSEVFPACVVTRAASQAAAATKSAELSRADEGILWPDSLLSVSPGELIKEQKADSTLDI